ncbi:MAG: threonylcarbamoyl-AMP synthase [Lachnospiraceae bacterium]|nr:threonylcarbamoyl-AMP synthase [Lachnospiraceae bacterium]
METLIAKINNLKNKDEQDYLKKAGQIIKEGGLVGFPTETVYGLGADALNEEAAAKIYAAKGRPSDNPLIVHISDIEMLYPLVKEIPQKAYKLIDKFWPGPMTLIFYKSDIVPKGTTGGLDTVAVRMPNNEIALELIRASQTGIAAPSGNLSGKPSPTIAEHMIDDMNGRIDMIIDGGMVGIGIESTIIDMTCEPPMILRPGYITKEMLNEIIGDVEYDKAIFEKPAEGVHPKAPGMKYRHYAPAGDFEMFNGEIDNVVKEIIARALKAAKEGKKVGIITTTDHYEYYENIFEVPGIEIVCMGDTTHPETIANGLYKVLRDFDKTNTEYILGETFATDNIGQAIMNRLTKAAGYNIISV